MEDEDEIAIEALLYQKAIQPHSNELLRKASSSSAALPALSRTLSRKTSSRQASTLVYTMILARVDIHDLTKDIPETSSIGNRDVVDALKYVAEEKGVQNVKSWLLAEGFVEGEEGSAEMQVREDDDQKKIDAQWKRLLELIENESTCLIYHMQGHYAPIYGARGWVCSLRRIVAPDHAINFSVLFIHLSLQPRAILSLFRFFMLYFGFILFCFGIALALYFSVA